MSGERGAECVLRARRALSTFSYVVKQAVLLVKLTLTLYFYLGFGAHHPAGHIHQVAYPSLRPSRPCDKACARHVYRYSVDMAIRKALCLRWFFASRICAGALIRLGLHLCLAVSLTMPRC